MRWDIFALRETWPIPGEDDPDILVIDADASIIGRIYREKATSQGRRQYFFGPGNLPRRADFAGHVEKLDEAKARFKEKRPQYKAQWSEQQTRKALGERYPGQLTNLAGIVPHRLASMVTDA